MFFNPYKIRNITIPRDYFRHHFPLNSDKMTRLISEWILVNQIQCTPTNPNPLYCWKNIKNVIIFITGLFRDVGKQCKEDIKTGKASFDFADSKFGDALPSKTRI